MKYKIFENGAVKEVIERMLKEGYVPLSSKKVWKLREEKKILDQWYVTRTCVVRGDVRDATLKELKNIQDFYESGGRLLLLGYDGYFLLGGEDLDDRGRFVGVKVRG